jgi:hypothetical protein
MQGQSAQFDLGKSGVALLLAELDHRILNLLTTIEAAVKQTHSTTVEDYRAKMIARITGLYSFCEFPRHYGRRLGLAQLLEQSMRPYSANGAQVLAAGPDVELEPRSSRCTSSFMSLPRTRANSVPEFAPRVVDVSGHSARSVPPQTRHRLGGARRIRSEASAACRVRVTAYQDSTRRIRRSAAGPQLHGSRLLYGG